MPLAVNLRTLSLSLTPTETLMMFSRLPPVLLLLSAGCWSPSHTGPRSMIGTVLTPDGEPVAGLRIDTLESSWKTDATGAFKVNYKAPSQYLHFTVGKLWFKRTYLPSDDDSVVQLTLPRLTQAPMRCDANTTCEAQLTYALSDGFTARLSAPCDPAAPNTTVAYPADALITEAVCLTSDNQTLPISARMRRGTLHITPPLATLDVELLTTSQARPKACEVRLDGDFLPSVGDGIYRGQTYGRVVIEASCDGIPAQPKTLMVRSDATATVEWSPDVPMLDVSLWAPLAKTIQLRQHIPRYKGWRMDLPVGEDGLVKLPPMPAGTYDFSAGITWDDLEEIDPMTEVEPDIFHYGALPPQPNSPEPLFGVLVLSRDLTDGIIDSKDARPERP